jgi:hypothetical protein
MDLVLECGAGYDTDEHYIATELFVKKDRREMFMTLPTNDIRFNWLQEVQCLVWQLRNCVLFIFSFSLFELLSFYLYLVI